MGWVWRTLRLQSSTPFTHQVHMPIVTIFLASRDDKEEIEYEPQQILFIFSDKNLHTLLSRCISRWSEMISKKIQWIKMRLNCIIFNMCSLCALQVDTKGLQTQFCNQNYCHKLTSMPESDPNVLKSFWWACYFSALHSKLEGNTDSVPNRKKNFNPKENEAIKIVFEVVLSLECVQVWHSTSAIRIIAIRVYLNSPVVWPSSAKTMWPNVLNFTGVS